MASFADSQSQCDKSQKKNGEPEGNLDSFSHIFHYHVCKWRAREVKRVAYGHPAGSWWGDETWFCLAFPLPSCTARRGKGESSTPVLHHPRKRQQWSQSPRLVDGASAGQIFLTVWVPSLGEESATLPFHGPLSDPGPVSGRLCIKGSPANSLACGVCSAEGTLLWLSQKSPWLWPGSLSVIQQVPIPEAPGPLLSRVLVS